MLPGSHLGIAPFNKFHGQGHLPGGFVSIRKKIELDFFSPQKNRFPLGLIFIPKFCGQWSLWAPNTQITGAHTPVIYLDDGMLRHHPFLDSWEARVPWCGKQRVDQENAQAAWLLQCDPEEADDFTHRKREKKPGRNVFFHHGMA